MGRGGFSQKATSIRKMLPDIPGITAAIRRKAINIPGKAVNIPRKAINIRKMLIAFGSKAPGMGWDVKVIGQIYSKRCQFQYNKIVISDL
jgi:hypothetical protein